VELELKQRGHAHPDVARLGRALSDEVRARGAHADDVAAEQRTTIADAVASDGEILVAYSDGAAVGIGALRPLGGGVGEVKRMYVVPEYRGAGVAKRILDALEQLARERGFEAVRLTRTSAWVRRTVSTGAPDTARSRTTTGTPAPIAGSRSLA